jgi:hypothetical protein
VARAAEPILVLQGYDLQARHEAYSRASVAIQSSLLGIGLPASFSSDLISALAAAVLRAPNDFGVNDRLLTREAQKVFRSKTRAEPRL